MVLLRGDGPDPAFTTGLGDVIGHPWVGGFPPQIRMVPPSSTATTRPSGRIVTSTTTAVDAVRLRGDGARPSRGQLKTVPSVQATTSLAPSSVRAKSLICRPAASGRGGRTRTSRPDGSSH